MTAHESTCMIEWGSMLKALTALSARNHVFSFICIYVFLHIFVFVSVCVFVFLHEIVFPSCRLSNWPVCASVCRAATDDGRSWLSPASGSLL